MKTLIIIPTYNELENLTKLLPEVLSKDNNINVRYDFHKDKELYLPMIDKAFPEAKLIDKLSLLQAKDRQNKILSQKFNGDIVMSWLPNLMGKELGQAITNFRNELGDEYEKFILNASYNEIKELFMETYNGRN